jgi:N4-gp56 family major capsid protein
MPLTKISHLIDPEVMAPMISGKISKAIIVTPFAKIDNTLQGQPGDEITVPKYAYIGDAEDVAEGVEAGTVTLTATTQKYKVKKAMKAVTLTDEAVLSAYGNPVGETNNQLAKAIASKVDADAISVLQEASLKKNLDAEISYNGIVDAIALFNEEVNVEKVMFVNPQQVATLRKDANFISADKYDNNVIMKGEIGMIANARIVPTRRVENVEGVYNCPIMQLLTEPETKDETPGLTIYLKRDTNVETERHTLSRTTDISADKIYLCALTNESKVVIAQFKAVTEL